MSYNTIVQSSQSKKKLIVQDKNVTQQGSYNVTEGLNLLGELSRENAIEIVSESQEKGTTIRNYKITEGFKVILSPNLLKIADLNPQEQDLNIIFSHTFETSKGAGSGKFQIKKKTNNEEDACKWFASLYDNNWENNIFKISFDAIKKAITFDVIFRYNDYELEDSCSSNIETENSKSASDSLQRILYGAPGTGKSHTIHRDTAGKNVIRTTFHPDSDYSAFVGCYKPFKPEGSDKITYQFVAQSFVKAYVEAWKKYIGKEIISSSGTKHDLKIADVSGNIFTIESVTNDKIMTTKDMILSKEYIRKAWETAWDSGSFIPEGKWNTNIEWAICRWITDNYTDCKAENFEEGWMLLTNTLLKTGSLPVSWKYGSKSYDVSYESDESVHVFSSASGNTKATIAKNYDAINITPTSSTSCLQFLLKKRDEANFENAWKLLQEEVNGSTPTKQTSDIQSKDVYLIVEEINRGNCAQIFGDIFQLLDRDDYGFSSYEIDADSDLQAYLKKEFESYEFEEKYADIKSGKKLRLPNNLYIWATMNTSDQSLFPMDSAFKRRWDWEYVAVDHEDAKKFHVFIGGKSYNWDGFITKVNKKIFAATQSADKQLGNRFCKADAVLNESTGKDDQHFMISTKQLMSKVMFYLWEDVCKDAPEDEQINFMRICEEPNSDGQKRSEYFIFQDLFENEGKSYKTNDSKDVYLPKEAILQMFMNYLNVPEEEKVKTDYQIANLTDFEKNQTHNNETGSRGINSCDLNSILKTGDAKKTQGGQQLIDQLKNVGDQNSSATPGQQDNNPENSGITNKID